MDTTLDAGVDSRASGAARYAARAARPTPSGAATVVVAGSGGGHGADNLIGEIICDGREGIDRLVGVRLSDSSQVDVPRL
ncbi:hypothetical protein GCM10022252_24000 [Streptosporangium oxazolinicum]|uniref:Uncharacterized protein n=1 Tax=Streptosporangium oxazolinicum TaxID=909287 RepID=A0ABP8ARP4_9ACTN